MDDLGAPFAHEERRLFDHVMTHIDNEVSRIDRPMHKIPGTQRGVAHKERMLLVDDAFAQLGGDKGNAQTVNHLGQHTSGHFTVGTSPNNEDRSPCLADGPYCGVDGFCFRNGSTGLIGFDWQKIGLLVGNVFRQLQMDRTGLFILCQTKRLADTAGDVVAGNDLVCVLGQRPHHVNNIEYLEPALFGLLNRLLTRQHHHGHPAQLRIGGRRDEVGRPRAKR